jgi:hypothetical protein
MDFENGVGLDKTPTPHSTCARGGQSLLFEGSGHHAAVWEQALQAVLYVEETHRVEVS